MISHLLGHSGDWWEYPLIYNYRCGISVITTRVDMYGFPPIVLGKKRKKKKKEIKKGNS
jgi:hypothetical protein